MLTMHFSNLFIKKKFFFILKDIIGFIIFC
jgi:hypothetical protein